MNLYFRGGLMVKLDADAGYTARRSVALTLLLGAAQEKPAVRRLVDDAEGTIEEHYGRRSPTCKATHK
jgi:hypothetical protein